MVSDYERKERKAESNRRYYEKTRYVRNRLKREMTLVNAGVGTCPECGKEFQRRRKDMVYCCNNCRRRASYSRNRETVLERMRAERLERRDEINEARREWRRLHPDSAKALDRKYRRGEEAIA